MKQVIVVRKDLKMGKGKLCTQVAHASIEAMRKAKKEWVEEWLSQGQKKVILKVNDERELLELFERIKEDLPAVIIRDAGLTQLPPGTVTAIGVGPAPDEKIDKHTSHLKLL